MNFKFLFLPAIVIATIALVVWWYIAPEQIGFVTGAATLIYGTSAWWLDRTRGDWWQLAFLPVLLFATTMAYGLLLSNRPIIIICAALLVIAETVYWRYAYLYAVRPASYPAFALERLSAYLNVVIIFSAAASAFGVRTFLGVDFKFLSLIFILVSALVLYQWVWISKVEWPAAWRNIVLLTVVMAELFASAAFLPLDFNVLGFLLATGYYALISLSADHLSHSLDRRRVTSILLIVAACWLIVLVTARWF